MHSSKVYTRLNDKLGLSDHLMVLNVILAKIATNLKVYGAAEDIIHMTLNLFQVSSSDCAFSRQLKGLQTALCNHIPPALPCLSKGGPAFCVLQDLASGYMSGKLLLKLEATAYILTHHTREHFGFLDDSSNARNRTTFYYTLARLLFMEDTPSKFKAFMEPLNQVNQPW